MNSGVAVLFADGLDNVRLTKRAFQKNHIITTIGQHGLCWLLLNEPPHGEGRP